MKTNEKTVIKKVIKELENQLALIEENLFHTINRQSIKWATKLEQAANGLSNNIEVLTELIGRDK